MFKKIVIGFGILLITLFGYAVNEYRLFSKTYKGISIDKAANQGAAFLIIDIQNDLTRETGKVHVDHKQVNQIIPNINKLASILKDINFNIIYIKHEYQSPFFRVILKNALSENSDGANFDERLALHGSTIFVKNYMDPFSNRQFQEYLNSNKIGNLLISGIDAKYCINKTVISAIQKGYDVTVVSDGIAGSSSDIRNEKIAEFLRIGAKTIKTAELKESSFLLKTGSLSKITHE